MELILMPREVEILQKIRLDDRFDPPAKFLWSIVKHLRPSTGDLPITVGQLAAAREHSKRWQHGLQDQFRAIAQAADRMGL
jgi:hypothetical protein